MRSIIMFLFMVLFIYLYSYIIGGDTSMLMLYMLLAAPLISLALTIPVRKRLSITVQVPTAEVEKDGIAKISVSIKNKSFLPIPFVELLFAEASNLKLQGHYEQRVSLGSFQTKTIIMEYTALRRGVNEVGVKSIVLRDYLGFFGFSLLKDFEEYEHLGKITVLPRLFSIKQNSRIMMTSSHNNVPEASGPSSTGITSWTGEPGHEFREYAAGDPLHKIHWKLSAKKDALMVRKDEARGVPRKMLIVDPCLAIEKKNKTQNGNLLKRMLRKENNMDKELETAAVEEKVLETLLSIAYTAVKTNRDVEVWLFENNQWIKYLITERRHISELQHRLAAYQFMMPSHTNHDMRLPIPNVLESGTKSRNLSGGEVIIVTGTLNQSLLQSIQYLYDYKMLVDTICIKSPDDKQRSGEKDTSNSQVLGYENLWILAADEDLREVFS